MGILIPFEPMSQFLPTRPENLVNVSAGRLKGGVTGAGDAEGDVGTRCEGVGRTVSNRWRTSCFLSGIISPSCDGDYVEPRIFQQTLFLQRFVHYCFRRHSNQNLLSAGCPPALVHKACWEICPLPDNTLWPRVEFRLLSSCVFRDFYNF